MKRLFPVICILAFTIVFLSCNGPKRSFAKTFNRGESEVDSSKYYLEKGTSLINKTTPLSQDAIEKMDADLHEAFRLFQKVDPEDLTPQAFLYLLEGYYYSGDFERGRELLNKTADPKREELRIIYSALFNLVEYARQDRQQVFDALARDTIDTLYSRYQQKKNDSILYLIHYFLNNLEEPLSPMNERIAESLAQKNFTETGAVLELYRGYSFSMQGFMEQYSAEQEGYYGGALAD